MKGKYGKLGGYGGIGTGLKGVDVVPNVFQHLGKNVQ